MCTSCGPVQSGLQKAVVQEKVATTAIPEAVPVLLSFTNFYSVKMCHFGSIFCESMSFSLLFVKATPQKTRFRDVKYARIWDTDWR